MLNPIKNSKEKKFMLYFVFLYEGRVAGTTQLPRDARC
jgi:hypothetical protein